LFSYLLDFPTLKLAVKFCSESPAEFQHTASHFIPDGETLHNERFENFRSQADGIIVPVVVLIASRLIGMSLKEFIYFEIIATQRRNYCPFLIFEVQFLISM
jgi:hypothetical protein